MIDGVYKTVQTILNKNNYGVLTPDRFNSFAKDVQLKIISELPDEMRRAKNRKNNSRMGSNGYTLSVNQVQNTLDIFKNKTTIHREPSGTSPSGFTDYFALPVDMHYLYEIFFKNCTIIEELKSACSGYVKCSSYVSPTSQYPTYERFGDKIYIIPENTGITINGTTVLNDDVSIYYQRTPIDPNWTFSEILNKPVFNPLATNYRDFELPEYMFDRIVIDICAMAGVTLREQMIIQYTQQEQSDKIQQKIIS